MNNMETYWAIANHTIAIINILVEGWLFYKFVQPFMKGKAYYVGISYSVAMLVFYCVPQEITYPYLWGIFMAGTMMCLLEKRKMECLSFQSTTLVLFQRLMDCN